MKLCKDCKWICGKECHAPQNMTKINPVTGEKMPRFLYCCESHRIGKLTDWFWCRVTGLCGKEGRWFVTKD